LEFQILGAICQQVNSNTFSGTFAGRKPQQVYARAIELARSLGDPASLYAAITELCNYHMIIAQYDLSIDLFSELEQLEQAHTLDPALRHSGIFARAYIAFYRADLAASRRLLEQLAPADPQTSEFGDHPAGRALALGHLACVHWVLGESDRALEEASETIRLAEQADSQILVALGHVVRARLCYLRRDPLPVIEEAAHSAMQAAALDIGLFTEANAISLWAQAQHQPLELSAIEPLLRSLRQRLQEVSTCSTLVGLALIETLRTSGHASEALQLTDEMVEFASSHNESVYLPELLRLRAEQIEQSDAPAAIQAYQRALELARASGARSLEQRLPSHIVDPSTAAVASEVV
jgi:tetratricopeptide (TPR) repeat protein